MIVNGQNPCNGEIKVSQKSLALNPNGRDSANLARGESIDDLEVRNNFLERKVTQTLLNMMLVSYDKDLDLPPEKRTWRKRLLVV